MKKYFVEIKTDVQARNYYFFPEIKGGTFHNYEIGFTDHLEDALKIGYSILRQTGGRFLIRVITSEEIRKRLPLIDCPVVLEGY